MIVLHRIVEPVNRVFWLFVQLYTVLTIPYRMSRGRLPPFLLARLPVGQDLPRIVKVRIGDPRGHLVNLRGVGDLERHAHARHQRDRRGFRRRVRQRGGGIVGRR